MQELGQNQKSRVSSGAPNSGGQLVAEREDMEIVFVHWRILKGREEKFLDYWKTGLPVNDRKGLVGEFLSQPSGHEKYNWITWDLRSSSGETTFINVGMWADPDEFHDQIGRYFNPVGGKLCRSKQQQHIAWENYILFLASIRSSFISTVKLFYTFLLNKMPNLVRNQGWLRHQTGYCLSVSKIQRRL
jgi:hypothetical protein